MRRHKPPSQIRYEKSHPVVSFRLDEELKKRLVEVLEGKSFASMVKEWLGEREREKKSLKNVEKKGYDQGYSDGFKHAMEGMEEADVGYDQGYIDGYKYAMRGLENTKKEVYDQGYSDGCKDVVREIERRERKRYRKKVQKGHF